MEKKNVPQVSMEDKAGLRFRVKSIQKTFNTILSYELSIENIVFLTGAIEYLVSEILELAGNQCHDNKRKRITDKHIRLAIQYDNELDRVIDTNVIPTIDVPKFHTSIYKILKQVHPDCSLSGDANRFMDKLIYEFIKLCASKIPSNKNVRDVVGDVLVDKLIEFATKNGDKAVTRYNSEE